MRRLLINLTILAVLAALLLSSCGVAETVSADMNAMDTYMRFSLSGKGSGKALAQIKELVKKLDSELSVTDENSAVFRLNQSGRATLSSDSAELLKKSLKLCERLDGALDISIFPIVDEWGFVSGDYKIPDSGTLAELLKRVDCKKISLSSNTVSLEPGMQIDLGAVAKGFCADRGFEILKKNGVESALLNFGGTIAVRGKKPDGSAWRVGIANPDNSSDCYGYVECSDTVAATSGGYERHFVGEDGNTYIHIIDPKTGMPVDGDLVSVTVLCKDGTKADALSTALYVKGLKGAIAEYKKQGDFDFVMMTSERKVYLSEGVKNSFHLANGFKATVETVNK